MKKFHELVKQAHVLFFDKGITLGGYDCPYSYTTEERKILTRLDLNSQLNYHLGLAPWHTVGNEGPSLD